MVHQVVVYLLETTITMTLSNFKMAIFLQIATTSILARLLCMIGKSCIKFGKWLMQTTKPWLTSLQCQEHTWMISTAFSLGNGHILCLSAAMKPTQPQSHCQGLSPTWNICCVVNACGGLHHPYLCHI